MKGMKQTTNLDDVRLHGGIHTLEMRTPQTLTKVAGADGPLYPTLDNTEDDMRVLYTWKINVNKYARETGKYREHYITSRSDFSTLLDLMMQDMGASEYQITRADFRVDSYETPWREMLKWNYALMYAIRAQLGWTDEVHRWDGTKPTVEVYADKRRDKRHTCDSIICYDRAAKPGNTAPTTMRLEFRNVRDMANMDVVSGVGAEWAKKIYHCVNEDTFTAMQQAATEQILDELRPELVETAALHMGVNKKALFIRSRERIFTPKQAVLLGTQIGLAPESVRKYVKAQPFPLNREWVTPEALRTYARHVTDALWRFLMPEMGIGYPQDLWIFSRIELEERPEI